MDMRTCRISKQSFASLWNTIKLYVSRIFSICINAADSGHEIQPSALTTILLVPVILGLPELGISLWQLDDTANWDMWRSSIRSTLALVF
ncbi:hypothetical protein AVEN_258750-1 [Araneus ventricosus]|uniref:Uncharacterized protein n=1 Tax=Araneus ventricosus TaxID=182803 RepID=A0A4Y2D1Z8_ARAVE|nr:hypothetical protein AVEN_258750-1 [Araneus ventricosus]